MIMMAIISLFSNEWMMVPMQLAIVPIFSI
jgi:hypothetical protein